MSEFVKPYVLSIAGFDPSGGAGILADIKTIEANGGYGLGRNNPNTYQNELSFENAEWLSLEKIVHQVTVLQKRFAIRHIKIGLIESLDILQQLVLFLRQLLPDAVIVWDPILQASAGPVFHSLPEKKELDSVLKEIDCITPNIPEAQQLFEEKDLFSKLLSASRHYVVYLKGGHGNDTNTTDVLFCERRTYKFIHPRLPKAEKHGSGCVLSASLVTQLALGKDMVSAAEKANQYTYQFLSSNKTLLGYHQYNFNDETDR
ncbi:MAG: hydroxymethylpyrimidine/phosphomethylpyrimidine kinase [Sediminibacterium sp.]